MPLVNAHWPAARQGRFFEKLRIGACDLYASAPYTALLCAPRRPPLIRLVTGAGNALPLSTHALARLGQGAMTLIGRVAYQSTHRRILLVASFIVVIDHVLDHCLDGEPEDRAARLFALLDGSLTPDTPELALTHALATAMAQGLDPVERRHFESAMARVREWIGAEVLGMRDIPDPRGLGHRLAGVEGTIDGLLFPVVKYTGEAARRWMYTVSMFVQIADDWLDAELDKQAERVTPVLRGDWGFAAVESAWRATLTGIDALAADGGLTSPRYVRFLRDAYVLMINDVLEAMIERPND
ncbi:MAG: hypothetical protein IPK82_42710 [Polyangiaceae bacterium]|nr:hypothetical protein [Polyangiaceae bacterium]